QLAASYPILNPLRGRPGGAVSDSVYGAKTSSSSSRWKMNRWLSRSHWTRNVTLSPRLTSPRPLECSKVLSLHGSVVAVVQWPTRERAKKTAGGRRMSEFRTRPMAAHTSCTSLPGVGVAELKKDPPRKVTASVGRGLLGQP